MSEQVCASCSAPLLWAITAKGKNMPLDLHPTVTGNVRLTGEQITGNDGHHGPECEVLGKPQLTDQLPDDLRYTSHFATCSDPERHRRRK